MLTKCPNSNCNSTLFEMVLGEPIGSRFKVWFVQCSVCGTAINAMEYLSLGTLLDDLEKRISNLEFNLEAKLSNIQQRMNNIESILKQLTDYKKL